MPVNLSIKQVPDALAAELRARAAANHRSLQRELMTIIEVAASNPAAYRLGDATPATGKDFHRRAGHDVPEKRSIEQVADALRALFPRVRTRGQSSTEIIRQMRDTRYGKVDVRGRVIK